MECDCWESVECNYWESMEGDCWECDCWESVPVWRLCSVTVGKVWSVTGV